jgi:hypothetical protein
MRAQCRNASFAGERQAQRMRLRNLLAQNVAKRDHNDRLQHIFDAAHFFDSHMLPVMSETPIWSGMLNWQGDGEQSTCNLKFCRRCPDHAS